MDFERMELTIRNGKVGNDRHTLIPESQCEGLKESLQTVRLVLRLNPPAGWVAGMLPHALAVQSQQVVQCQGGCEAGTV